MNRQTTLAKENTVSQNWLIVDASDQVLGRIASRLAVILMGKNKPQYTPHRDVGDYVILTNASKIRMTGSKLDQKLFQSYSGYPGGRRTRTYGQMMETNPQALIQRSVRNMLPKNKLGDQMIKKLKIYSGTEHPHSSQQPQTMELA